MAVIVVGMAADSSPPLTSPPSVEDTRAFLQKQGVPVETQQAPAFVEGPKEVEGLDAGVLQRAATGASPLLPEPEIPLDSRLNPPADPWAMRDPLDPETVIVVTPEERDEYWRTMLHGTMMTWNIALFQNRLEVKVEHPPAWLQQFLDDHYDRVTRGLPAGASQARVINQYTTALVLIRAKQMRTDDKVILAIPDFGFNPSADDAHNANALEKLHNYRAHQVTPQQMQALFAGCRVADMKWNICVRKQTSQNFWQPAATA